MATRTEKVQIVVGAKDKASSTLLKVKNQIIGIGAAYLGFRAITGILSSITKAGMEHEKVWTEVAGALKRQGHEIDNNIKSIKKFSDEMQTLTGVSDEVFGKGIQLFIDYGATIDEAKDTMRVAADLAAGSGMEMSAAVDLLAKAQVGYTGTLSRYGIILDESIPKSEKFAAATEQINEKFGGAAADRMETTAVKVDLMSQKFGDLQEELFKLAAPGLLAGVEILTSAIGSLSSIIQFLSPPAVRANEEIANLEIEIKKLEQTRGSTEQIAALTEELEGLKQAAMDSASEIVNFLATTDAVERYREMSVAIKEGIEIDVQALAQLKFDFEQLPVAVTDATNQLIAGLDVMAIGFQETGEDVGLTIEEIGNIVSKTNEGIVASTASTAIFVSESYDEQLQAYIDYLDKHDEYAQYQVELAQKANQKRLRNTLAALNKERAAFLASEKAKVLAAARSAQEMGAFTAQFTNTAIAAFGKTKREADEIWKDMAKAFMNFFIKKALAMLLPGGPFISGLLGALRIFDVAANDRMAMQMGRDYVSFFAQGANQAMGQFTSGFAANLSPAFNGPMLNAANGPAAGTVINITVSADIDEGSIRGKIAPILEELANNRFTNIAYDESTITGESAIEFA